MASYKWGYQIVGAFHYPVIVDLRMKKKELDIGDDAAHGEEAYALWGDGEKMPIRWQMPPTILPCADG
ncbi:hypothetical protein GBA52_025305 [Prunus armeniaca]|nr:hypothetical protein GBA52_025305 [Prunus armeniaca]